MSEAAAPVEDQLESEPVVEPVAEPVAEPAPEPEPVAAPPVEPAPPQGMLQELIHHRQEAKRLAREVEALKAAQAPRGPSQAEQAREQAQLEATAQRLRLYTQDEKGVQVLDLDAAKRVRDEVTDVARSVAAEVVAPVRHATAREQAMANVDKAMSFAKAQGQSDDALQAIREAYTEVLAQPNGAEMVANPDVALSLWHNGVGRAATKGLWKTGPVPAPVPAAPPVIPAPATGRRAGGQAAIQLSPAAQRVYRENNLDPAKTKTYTPAADGSISLED